MSTAIHIADMQVPFHDRKSWKLVLSFIKEWKPDFVISHGDAAECYHYGSYDQSPLEKPSYLGAWNADVEIAEVQKSWKQLHEATPKSTFLYTLGNHEDRVRRSKMKNNKETIISSDTFVDIFKVHKWWNEIVEWGYGIKLGHLWCTHGDTTSLYAARKMLQMWGSCVAFGHCHRNSFWMENPKGDNLRAAWGIPCLCRLDPRFVTQPNWSHGFAFSKFFPSGNFSIQVIPIIGSSWFVFGNKIYKSGIKLVGEK